MADRVRPYRLKIGNIWAIAYATLDAARASANSKRWLSGQPWKIERQATRYGKRELIEEGVTP